MDPLRYGREKIDPERARKCVQQPSALPRSPQPEQEGVPNGKLKNLLSIAIIRLGMANDGAFCRNTHPWDKRTPCKSQLERVDSRFAQRVRFSRPGWHDSYEWLRNPVDLSPSRMHFATPLYVPQGVDGRPFKLLR